MSESITENGLAGDAQQSNRRLGFLPPELLAKVQALYDEGLCVQAFNAGCLAAPLEGWRGLEASILAGRIANNLGAHGIAVRQHIRAYRNAPTHLRTRAYHLELVLAHRGPIFAWQRFRGYEAELKEDSSPVQTDEGWEYLFSLGARVAGSFRDFERAEEYFRMAERHRSKMPWLLVEKAGMQVMRERWQDALKLAQAALEARPWYRQAIQYAAQCLHTLNLDEEALRLLGDAAQRIESLPVLQQLAGLQMDLEKYDEALVTLDRAERLSPIMDGVSRQWIGAMQCRAAGITGNHTLTERAARQVGGEYHLALAERVKDNGRIWRRKQMPVPFIQQFRMTCVPATLTMLRHFWNLPADQVEVAEAICFDGTPTHRARRWAEANGMIVREFTLNWELAVALLDRDLPFAVFTADATSGHVQVVAGYDELRRTFIIRNPSFPQIQEVEAERFLKHYKASGPACMLLVPAEQEAWTADLQLPDSDLYDRLRDVQTALEKHQREAAGISLDEMRRQAPDHRLTLTAERAICSYDTNLPALVHCLDQLLKKFPEDANLLLVKLGCLREIGRREERLELLQSICARAGADAIFQQQLGLELMADARESEAAGRALKKSLRHQPLNVATLGTLANLYWNQRRFDEALDTYRFAAYLDDKKEPPASTYFAAAVACRKTEEALIFLQKRCERNIANAPGSFCTWFNALQQCGRLTDALKQLEVELQRYPDHGELWLFAADINGRHGDFKQADLNLAKAESKVQRNAFLKAKADLARYQTDGKSAAALWREVLQLEPLSMEVHRSLAWLLAENAGRQAALEHLRDVCGRFPYHYRLHQLWCEWARQTGPEAAEVVVRKLVQAHPADAWARRELALVLTEAGRLEEALAEAEEGLRLSPHAPIGYTTRARIRMATGLVQEARNDYRESIHLMVDYGPAIHGLVYSGTTLEERQQSLTFIEQELVRQVVYGNGLQAYRDAARLNLEPKVLLESLRVALTARPDLGVAWSVVIQQLSEMLQLEEGLTLGLEATQRFPLSARAWLDLALVHRLRMDNAAEKAALEQAMQVAPLSNDAVKMLADHFDRRGERTRAHELYVIACAREPLDAYSHGHLALSLWERGNRSEALERIQHAVRLQPDYMWGWQQLARWSAADGRPKLAEDLAKLMMLQRPGEVRFALVLARLLFNTRLEEALQVVDHAIKDASRNVDAHELRAEILAALNRQAEADSACEGKIWGGQIPAGLRACRASLEARRGNLASAIERIKEVLRENPGYVAGWQSLSDWHWRRGQFDEAVAAATNIRRLNPLSPVPLGYRASLKLRKKETAEAKADFETAIKLDPSYTYAALNLFELQLEDSEIDAAWRTLDLIKRHESKEKSKACEIKLRTRSLQVAAARGSKGSKESKDRQVVELDQAFQQVKELCSTAEASAENVDQAIKALLRTGPAKRVDQLLSALILLPNCNPEVGNWWMQRRIEKGKWYCSGKVSRRCPESAAARNAVIKLIECLGQQDGKIGRTFVYAHMLLKLSKMIGRLVRLAGLLWLRWRHRCWLRSDDDAWATMGLSLFRLRYNRTAAGWMRGWRERQAVKMWMLYNLALAMRALQWWNQAKDVLEYAVNLPERDHSFQALRLLLCWELAIAGNTKDAQAHFREIKTQGWTAFMQIQFQYAKGILAVQQAAPEQKEKVFRSERAAIKEILTRHRVSRYRVDYRRSMIRMAKDARQPWYVFLTWVGY